VLADFQREYGIRFTSEAQLKLALTHRSYLHVTGQRDSNERLEFLGDSVLGLVTSEHLYRAHPGEHEGQLTKTKSLLVSKAILSRRALAMGLGRFVLMSHSEMESGGRQRLSILADAFEAVIGAIYLDQGFEAARSFIERWLLRDTRAIVADKRHTNYKSHLQEYVQSTYRTHPVYRIRSEVGPDHSKQFMVEVIVGRRTLGEGKGRNKKEAEQAAARDALERVESGPASDRSLKAESRTGPRTPATAPPPPPSRSSREPAAPAIGTRVLPEPDMDEAEAPRRRRRGRRGGRGRRREGSPELQVSGGAERTQEENGSAESRGPAPEAQRLRPRTPPTPPAPARPIVSRPEGIDEPRPVELEPLPPAHEEDDFEEVGRPEGPSGERFSWPESPAPRFEPVEEPRAPLFEPADEAPDERPEPMVEEMVAEPEPPRPAPVFPRETASERPATPSPATPVTPPASPPPPAFGRRPGRTKR
jgi:ribonuclease-3